MNSSQFNIELYIYLISSIGIFLLMMIFVVFVLILYSRRQKQYLEETKRKEMEFKHELSTVQHEVLDNLMKQVYAEIHDNLGQQAAVLKLELHSIEKFQKPELALGAIDTLNGLIEDMKALSVSLNPQVVKSKNLSESLLFEVKRLTKTGLFKVECNVEDIDPLPTDVTLILYRVAQELLQNILKHSKATELKISLIENGNEVHLEIEDNGIGIEASKKEGVVSTGLNNLAKRCELISAKLNLSSSNKGTIAKIIYIRGE